MPELPDDFFCGKGMGTMGKGGVVADVEVDAQLRENMKKYFESWFVRDFETSDKYRDLLRASKVESGVLINRYRQMQKAEEGRE